MEPLAPSDPDRIASYELLGRLGAGGMGLVYKARSPGGRLVAVKVIHTQYTDDPRFLRRFRREVEAARSVSGFYTAPVVDADTESRPAWLATAHVAGPSLGAAVQSRGPLPGREVTALAAALAEALKAVHAAGLVHRDLKPSNILLAEDGPRVIDFGIVQAVDGTATTGGLIGTPEYMAPEQIDADGEIGPASDVFALGGVLYCAATGRPPFGTGDARAVLYRVQTAEPDLGRVPVELRDLIGRCLAKEPSLRPTPDEILAELAGSVADGPVDWTGGPQDTRTDEPTAGTDEGTTGAAPHSDPEPGPEPERAPEPRPATAPVRPPRPEPPPERPPETLSRTSAALRRRGWALLAATALVGTVAFVVLDLGGSGGGGGFRPWSVADAQGAAVIADGLAYIGMKDGTAAHDARTGQRRWKSVSGEPEAVATRYGGVLLVRSETRLSALDPRSGNRLWQFPLEDDGCVTRSSPKGNFVVIGKSHWQRGTRISGVEAATGA
ncbi:protein kinase domain-containing protein, partial [Actinomadura welshii]